MCVLKSSSSSIITKSRTHSRPFVTWKKTRRDETRKIKKNKNEIKGPHTMDKGKRGGEGVGHKIYDDLPPETAISKQTNGYRPLLPELPVIQHGGAQPALGLSLSLSLSVVITRCCCCCWGCCPVLPHIRSFSPIFFWRRMRFTWIAGVNTKVVHRHQLK